MKFLRNLLASILGSLVAFGILMGMFFIFLALIGNVDDGVVVKKNSVLELSFVAPILDYTGKDETDPFAAFGGEELGLDEILHAIKVAKNDDNIEGISITTGYLMAGVAQTREIRKALLDFKSSGKFVMAHSDVYAQRDYYLASAADEVYINPVGVLDFKGLATEVLFFKELQEKSGIKIEVIRHGKYKSAVEPFLSDTMSDENRTQIKELISSIWNVIVDDISESRNITPQNLNTIADTLGGRTPEYAVASGLLDGILHYDEYEGLLKEKMEVPEDDELNYVGLRDYVQKANKKSIRTGSDKIAVIYAQGEILGGEGGKDYIGQDLIVDALHKAVNNEHVKAIVLRVNSPGGSALVSDIIWREIQLAKKEKPLVVSFGNVAASGGYYIGVGGDKIFAEPTTITGSIGVFGTIPNVHELAKNMGVNAEQVGTNKNSVDYSFFEPMTDSFRNVMQESIEETYDTFLDRVSKGRNMSVEQVNKIAQGRVWSGVDAQAIGLVDELGTLDDAIAAAAEMAGLESYGVRKYPKYKSDFERFMEDFGSVKTKLGESIIQEEIGAEAYEVLKEFKQFTKQEGVQAKMPFSLKIK
ncbi:signal peptide peptidase SppA, 67K type [Allomuricauda ruestringensis DSM 13258]|uniref:Signal peptide peptidase SppA, 67K type n=1 Tax=Allomuricauda ruestringensis (strain DSM 13258 / CIP 107369 / LMG 19739 / B1) TaxID=886377 RepID=G2PJZ2_ALLRU|nr:signal peptide peptidase SppA [Allomuricauda ruestringensis]AEM70947.1 signal peptide peptidase SppA, 67K type [Allomuricauda ruestringensis DSM 13258]